jgi:predicted ATPase
MVELLERDQYINDLLTRFQRLESDGGHAVFIRGEAGIGKTSLLNYLTINLSSKAKILSGSCDSLFTPRPLGPIFDMARLISSDFLDFLKSETSRSIIFEALVDKLSEQNGSVIMIFEDIHWADEATLDFIKFITKRINKYKCLFLLTYRSDEINSDHPLSAIFGDLPSLNYSKVELKQFSHKTVNRLAFENDLLGDQLYSLTAGNPFYVMEVLKHKNSSIPERIKDLVLAVFSSKDEKTKEFLEILSVIPTKIEVAFVKHIAQGFPEAYDECLNSGMLLSINDYILFKHELFRLAIEESLTSSKRSKLNKYVLKLLQEVTGIPINLSLLVHHAKIAGERNLIEKFAPKAAKESAQIGAHREAVVLYNLAIEYSSAPNSKELAELYNGHAHESYLTFQIQQAIDSQKKALEIWHNHEGGFKTR